MARATTLRLRRIEATRNLTHVALEGPLDLDTIGEIEDSFAHQTAGRRRPVVVDLSGVTFLGSLGIRMLLMNAAALRRDGQRMVALKPSAHVEKVLRVSGAVRALPVAKSLAQALVLLRTDA